MNNYLVIRNLRGNWSWRYIFEFISRNEPKSHFGFLDASRYEYFPPFNRAPIFLNSVWREKIISFIFFNNSLPDTLKKQILQRSKRHRAVRLKFENIKIVWHLLGLNSSAKLSNNKYNSIPFGRFAHTTLIANYGIKHFSVPHYKFFGNILLFLRFTRGYVTTNHLIINYKYSCVVLINGRDAFGVGAQLAAYLNNVSIKCLEAGFGSTGLPKYGLWNGNMHHWRVRESESKTTVSSNYEKYKSADAEKFMQEKYGFKSAIWRENMPDENSTDFIRGTDYVCFFATSEKEATTCPSGIIDLNDFDEFDQIQSLTNVYEACKSLSLKLVIRLHPNFSNNKQAKNENNFFLKLAKDWCNTTIIENNDSLDSYKLATYSKANFTFRSSLSAEFAFRGINVFHTAKTAWSYHCPEKLAFTVDEIIQAINFDKISYENKSYEFYTFASYYQNHGKDFKSLKFYSINDKLNVNSKYRPYINKLNDTELDIPKTNFKLFRF
jgi:hypothetical protein